jgi:hypothetical protein
VRVDDGADEQAEFELGQASAFETSTGRDGDRSLDAPGETLTVTESPWHFLVCEGCGHTFRRGDRVWRDPRTRMVRHLDLALGCNAPTTAEGERGEDENAGALVAGSEAEAVAVELAEFALGLDEAWPPALDVPALALTPSDWRVRRPRGSLRRPSCRFCGHTFRAGDLVVVCPCSPTQPRCGAAVHRHPAAGLVCWETWLPSGEVQRCPITSALSGTSPLSESRGQA